MFFWDVLVGKEFLFIRGKENKFCLVSGMLKCYYGFI